MSNRRRQDKGFTLPEVLITIVMISLVVGVIATALVVILRTSPAATARTDDSRTYQGLVTWFPRDVASTPSKAANISNAPGSLACAGAEIVTGNNLIEFRWNENAGGGVVTYVAAYRFETVSGGKAVRRYTCSSAGSYSDTSKLNLTSPLDDSAPVVSVSSGYDLVTMTFVTTSGQVYVDGGQAVEVQAATRNPEATLPPATPTETLPPPTAPPTTPPPAPCAVAFTAPLPSDNGPEELDDGPPANRKDKLKIAVPLTMTVTGDTCLAITIRYNTGVELKTQPVTVTGTAGSVTIPQGTNNAATPKWTFGTFAVPLGHTIEVYSGSTLMTSTILATWT